MTNTTSAGDTAGGSGDPRGADSASAGMVRLIGDLRGRVARCGADVAAPFLDENARQWRRVADLLDTAYQLALLGQHAVAMEAVHAAQVAADTHASQLERAARELPGGA